jgi:hypothetical protein
MWMGNLCCRLVQRHPCGVAVNVLSYRNQPQCFWREALKQLMHSMNMGMVRDSAVGNFVERLQRSASAGNAAVVPGWLELRKGVHSYLTAAGDLVVLRDGVFRRGAAAVLSSTTLNQRRQQALSQVKKATQTAAGRVGMEAAVKQLSKLQSELSRAVGGLLCAELDCSTGQLRYDAALLRALWMDEYPAASAAVVGEQDSNELTLGPWRLTVSLVGVAGDGDATDQQEGSLQVLSGVLPGTFSYDVAVPAVGTTVEGAACADGAGTVTLQLVFQRDLIQSLTEEVQLQNAVVAQWRQQLLQGQGQGLRQGQRDAAGEQAGGEAPENWQGGELLLPSDVASAEGRLRSGLPLLVPVLPSYPSPPVEGAQRVMRVTGRYVE